MNTQADTEGKATVRVPIAAKESGPHVEVIRNGAVVTMIRVSCNCGAGVDITCDYEEVPS